MRKTIIRISLILLLLILGIVLFILGKEHKIFVDNMDFTINGETYSADSSYEVWIDGQKLGRTTINPGKRNVNYAAGPGHEIVLQEIVDGEPVGGKIIKEFRLSVAQGEVTINIPALIGDSEFYLY